MRGAEAWLESRGVFLGVVHLSVSLSSTRTRSLCFPIRSKLSATAALLVNIRVVRPGSGQSGESFGFPAPSRNYLMQEGWADCGEGCWTITVKCETVRFPPPFRNYLREVGQSRPDR